MKAAFARIGHLAFWLLIVATFPVALWFFIVAGLRNAMSDSAEVPLEATETT